MLTIPKWKVYTIIFTCLISIYLSIPTLFPQITDSSLKSAFPANKVNLGLDLRGGASLLLEVDSKHYFSEQLENTVEQIKTKLRMEKIGFEKFNINEDYITIHLSSTDSIYEAKTIIYNIFGNTAQIEANKNVLILSLAQIIKSGIKNNLMAQTQEIIRRRIDETGTKEVDLQMQGDNQILLQVPGLENPEQIKRLLGQTAKLSFHLVDDSVRLSDAANGKVPYGSKLLPLDTKERGNFGKSVLVVKSRAALSGDMLTDAQTTVNNGSAVVHFKLTGVGSKIFADLTSKNTGKLLAIVLDGKIISAPGIREPILGGSGTISGNFSIQSANELALLLRAGALPAPINIVEERTVGPSLGADSIEAGIKAVVAGVILVMLLMFVFYGLFGMVANFALLFNLLMTIAALSLFSATLTLPGIAGMVLTLGMAVDANVLIFERVKEEVKKGKTPLSALESGYNLAFSTILDSNLTTILAAIILYIFGTGPVKGFAVTLTIGILCSMFTAVSLTKLIIAKWYRTKKPKLLML
ncbi:protein translocase subunit SecD [Holosporaceae bacterium 'Namur']|nr:protein translocase subunit SecD [Holosporaceae bacterium 'Namur']